MAERSRIAVLISGRGSNMLALIYAARAEGCPYEVALVTGDKPDAPGLDIARAEGMRVEALDAKALGPAYWDKLQQILEKADIDLVALAGFMRIIPDEYSDVTASAPSTTAHTGSETASGCPGGATAVVSRCAAASPSQ